MSLSPNLTLLQQKRIDDLDRRPGQISGTNGDEFCHMIPICIMKDIVRANPDLPGCVFDELLGWSNKPGNSGNGRYDAKEYNRFAKHTATGVSHVLMENDIRGAINDPVKNEINPTYIYRRAFAMLDRIDNASGEEHLSLDTTRVLLRHLGQAVDHNGKSLLERYSDETDKRKISHTMKEALKTELASSQQNAQAAQREYERREEQARQRQEQARREREEQARRQREEQARRQREEQARREREEQARRQREEQARRQREEQARQYEYQRQQEQARQYEYQRQQQFRMQQQQEAYYHMMMMAQIPRTYQASSSSSGSTFYKGGQFTPGGGRAPKGGCWM